MKRTAPLEIIAPDPHRHAEEMTDLIAKVFSHQGYYTFLNACRNGYVLHSHYDWAASRIGLIDGRIVTHWGVWDYQMRIGSAAVRVAGVGVVATDDAFRRRGLMAQTGAAAMAAAREQGYDLSLLFGIDDFYHRFGYVRAWSSRTMTVETKDLPQGKTGVPLPRRSRPRVPRLQPFEMIRNNNRDALYNHYAHGLTGTAIRPTYHSRVGWMHWEGYEWPSAGMKLAGYVMVAPDRNQADRLLCLDAAGDAQEILQALGLLAQQRDFRQVRFLHEHPRSDLAHLMRRGNCREEITHRVNGGAMVCTINLASCLEKMCPELSRRVAASPLAKWKGHLLLDAGGQRAVVEITNGKVSVPSAGTRLRTTRGRSGRNLHALRPAHAIVGGEHLVQLLIGTDEPSEIIDAAGMKTRGQGRELAQVLFPAQGPTQSGWDYF